MNEVHIFCHGGIGDQIIALPFIELFKDKGQKVIVYTKFKEILSIFLNWVTIKTREEFPRQFPPPLWIEIIDIVKFNITSQNILKTLPNYIQTMYYNWEKHQNEWGKLIYAHPGSCNAISTLSTYKGLTRHTLAHYLVGAEYKRYEFDCRDIPGQFITIHDGFDDSHKFDISTKSWNIDKFSRLVDLIKISFPNLKIIQLGGIKHRVIKGAHDNLAGRLAFRESLRYLKSAILHIDGDSGLVHARALFKKPSVVLFGPTPLDYFAYPENINIKTDFCGNCFWLKNDWMMNCVKSFPMVKASACMDDITPEQVLERIEEVLK